MRRLLTCMLAVAVLAGGCSSDGDDDGAAPGTSSPTVSTPSTPTSEATPHCRGVDPMPATYEITWVAAGRLWAVPGSGTARRCLLDTVDPQGGIAWGGGGDRLLLGNKVVFSDGRVEEPFPAGGRFVLSRPTGKSVLDIRAGRLNKRELGKTPAEISFVPGHGETVYHPTGMHIVSVGSVDGRPVLQMATNTGQGARDLVENHTARGISNPVFTASGALLFIADHGTYTDVHRLEIDAGKLTEVARENGSGSMAKLVASPFEGGGVAWAQGDCADGKRRLRAQRGGAYMKTEGTAVEFGDPVGWTPDAGLLVLTPNACNAQQETAERTLFVFKEGVATEVARSVQAAAVRAVLPPPPSPPGVIPEQAPA